MKLSVICKTNEWQVLQLQDEAKRLSIELEVVDLFPGKPLPDTLGDVVLWRSSSLGGGDARISAMNSILQNHFLINRCLAKIPKATEKFFQQQYIKEKAPSINCIPTLLFGSIPEIEDALKKNILRFPFIAKPNKGSKGEGVVLINKKTDLSLIDRPLKDCVFQNFIKNSGDYRVFVLGGKVLGVIKRTAKSGGFLNNISKGGSAEVITDEKILSSVQKIGTTVASVFQLTLCGVDVIFDEENKKFFFLEVNTVPQWKGFQEATGINVAKEILLFCKRITHRKNTPLKDLVVEEYLSQMHFLRTKKFHFLSRISSWTGDPAYKEMLQEIKKGYIGETPEEHEEILRRSYALRPEHGSRMIAKEARIEYFNKYSSLEPFLNVLFKNLFAKKIYNIDLRKIIEKIVSDEDFLELKRLLEKDVPALQVLSTHAINYLYLLEFYLGKNLAKVPEDHFLSIGLNYKNNTGLKIYFLTHCIIGASRFYNESIPSESMPIYIRMMQEIEQDIEKDFESISLDHKFEFLVCAKICNFRSSLEEKILQEAERSLSPDGNFLIDTENSTANPEERNDFVGSEHRNILFIMSQTPYIH